MRLVGASPRAKLRGKTVLPGRHNYYLGNDPKRWHTGIPTYSKVISTGVYPGIDVVYYGNEGRLEYDFMVAPHADPSAITLSFPGNGAMRVNSRGDLVLRVGGEQVLQRRPIAYQTVKGAKVLVEVRYAVNGRKISFRLGRYDTGRPLVIDPALIYASFLGASGDDEARAVAVDGAGNIYIAGQTSSTAFPGTSGSWAGGNSDAFVTMLDSSGAVIFSTYLGSDGTVGPSDPNNYESSGEKANGIAVGANGKIYVTGGTATLASSSSPFPTTTNAYQACATTTNSVFVSVLNADGTLDYSTCVGPGNAEEGMAIAVDGAGDAYVAGWTNAANFPTTSPGALQTTKKTDPNLRDSFFFKLNPAGTGSSDLVYSTYLGSTIDNSVDFTICCNTYATGVAVDGNGMAYVSGWTTNETSGGVLPAVFEDAATSAGSSYSGGRDAFFYKLNPDPADTAANNLLYATYLGGSGDDMASGVAINSAGSAIYVAGRTTSGDFPTLNAYQSTYKGGTTELTDAFVARYVSAGGNNYNPGYSTFLGGSDDDNANGIAVDGSTGRVYVTGATSSTDFPVAAAGGMQDNPGGATDAFVTSLSGTGTLHYSTFLGAAAMDKGLAIAASQDGKDKVYIVGSTNSIDFPVTSDAAQNIQQGGISNFTDAFVAVIGTVADMAVTLSATTPAPALLETLTYTAGITNNGPDTATGVTLTLALSAPGTSVPLSTGSLAYDSRCTIDAVETLTCALGTMAAGAQTSITLSGALTTAQQLTATAVVSANEKDTNTVDNTYGWNLTAGSSSSGVPPVVVQNTGGGGAMDPWTVFAALILMVCGARPSRYRSRLWKK